MSDKKFPPPVVCSVPDQFGPHEGPQVRVPRYFLCGCDAGFCEKHAKAITYEPGHPRRCHKHRLQPRKK